MEKEQDPLAEYRQLTKHPSTGQRTVQIRTVSVQETDKTRETTNNAVHDARL
jgi:hypothetical protein